MSEQAYEVSVWAWGLDPAAQEALFERVIEAAHALDEQVTCTGGLVLPPADPEA